MAMTYQERMAKLQEQRRLSRRRMRRVVLGVLTGVLLAGVGVVVFVPEIHEPWDFDAARKADTQVAYEAYLLKHPSGEHMREAWGRVIELRFETARAAGTIEAYEAFVAFTPPPEAGHEVLLVELRRQADAALEGLRFTRAIGVIDSALALRPTKAGVEAARAAIAQFRKDHPASARLAEFGTYEDRLDFADARLANTPESFERYALQRPEGAYALESLKLAENMLLESARLSAASQREPLAVAGVWEAFLSRWTRPKISPEAQREASEAIDRALFDQAQLLNTEQSFLDYLQAGGPQKFAGRARELLDSLRYTAAVNAESIEALESYLADASMTRHRDQAAEQLDRLQWRRAERTGSVDALEGYLESAGRGPGRFAERARAMLGELRSSEDPFLLAEHAGTQAAYEAFLAGYPGHGRAEFARRRLEEIAGLDLLDLVSGGTVQYDARGDGQGGLTLRLKRFGQHPVRVRLGAGLFWQSTGDAQSLVTRRASEVVLDRGGWVEVPIATLGARISARPAGPGDTLLARPASSQAELGRLLSLLSDERYSESAAQAACWLVTSNPRREELLAQLGARFAGESADDRMIEALQLCQQANVAIERLNLWKDRVLVQQGARDARLREWLGQAIRTIGS